MPERTRPCSPAIFCRCPCWCSMRPTSPSTSAGRGARSCSCSKASRALRRSTASHCMRSAATSPCPPSFVCSNTGASPTRPAPSRARTSCCAIAIPASIAREVFAPSDLTLDHVIPRSRGGSSTWENLVACCHACNRRKGNRLLSEIDDMVLLREPRPFSLHTSRQIMRMLGRGDDRWRKYLFY